jgi:hypothetical protein
METLQDVDIEPNRFCQGEALLTPKEITACRASLGALQCLAVQTQPLICARCNLLITELAGSPKMSTAREIQEMIRELRKHSTVLKFFKLSRVQTWKDVCVVGLGDQAHNNRPKGGSTGGMLIFLACPEIALGKANPLVFVAWKSWKLKRVAISANDAEVQALVETEDAVYRTRLLLAELNGAGVRSTAWFLNCWVLIAVLVTIALFSMNLLSWVYQMLAQLCKLNTSSKHCLHVEHF